MLALGALLAGCGGVRAGPPAITVSAAASLKSAFTAYASYARITGPHFSFAGSDILAVQIREGARPDVYAAANTRLPQQLAAAGLVSRPVVFASNRLVIAVPASSPKVSALADLEHPGITIALGAPGVPIGSYTRELLARLGPVEAKRILANVRSAEPDVAGIVGKLAEGAVDAGFVYASDVIAARGQLKAIAIPARLNPRALYAAAVVTGARHPNEARRFVEGLRSAAGRRALTRAGFEPANGR